MKRGTSSNPSLRRLPVVRLNGIDYFVDVRLSQLRRVDNPHSFVDFDTDEGRSMYAECLFLTCAACSSPAAVELYGRRRRAVCPTCGAKVPPDTMP
jgi:hypothetical protein